MGYNAAFVDGTDDDDGTASGNERCECAQQSDGYDDASTSAGEHS